MKRRAVPPGLEILLKKAKVDPVFRDRLETDPDGAAAYIGLKLTDVERSILANVSAGKLGAVIDNTNVPRQHVHTFLTRSATAMLTVVLSTTVAVDIFATGVIEESYIQAEEIAIDDLAFIQAVLEAYRVEFGRYPTTEEWYLSENPFRDIAELHAVDSERLRDYEGDRYRYRGELTDGVPTAYKLGTLNAEYIDCPEDPEMHRFVGPNRIAITTPSRDTTQWTLIALALEEGETAAAFPLRVEHDDPGATVAWYWDKVPVGSTRTTHEIMPVIVPGEHELFVVDENGYSDYLRMLVKSEEEIEQEKATEPEATESEATESEAPSTADEGASPDEPS